MTLRPLFMILLLLSASAARSEDESPAAGQQVEQEFTTSDSATVPYLLYLPRDYDENDEPVPLMLFLHGRGESDGPLQIVTKWGPPRMVKRGDDLPYILVSPQCPPEEEWRECCQQKRLVELLDAIIEKYRVDESRIYLTGLSMGGYGSWRLAADHPERFAAVVPICGGGDPADADQLKSLPIWVFHGEEDEAVPLECSVEMVEAIKKAGGEKIRFTSLEHVGHNSWSPAYALPELYEWLDEQQECRKR